MNKRSQNIRNIISILLVAVVAGSIGYFISNGATSDQEASVYQAGMITVPNTFSYSWSNGKCYYNWTDDAGGQNSQLTDIALEKDCKGIAAHPIGGTETWWPAGNGFCYHKIRTQWASYWTLGEISGVRCVDIQMASRMNDLEKLLQQKGISVTGTGAAVPAKKTN